MSADTKAMDRWARPQEIDDATMVFPASVCGTLLPPMDEIPETFQRRREEPWSKLVSKWFFEGLDGRFVPKDGIEEQIAVRHLNACIRSWEPKHEHKEAGVAWLMSKWFVRYEESTP